MIDASSRQPERLADLVQCGFSPGEVSNDAAATVSGGYWYQGQRQTPAPQVRDPAFQDQLMHRLATLTGVALL